MKKPREFWISNLGGKYVVDFDSPNYIKEAKTYHVREVSPERDRAVELMVEALEFYVELYKKASIVHNQPVSSYINKAFEALEAWKKVK